MYSKQKTYKKYKRTKSQIFNGTGNSKYNIPTINQQKGRTIQPQLSRLYNPPMEMPSTQSLQRMYNTLVQYKYKFPTPPVQIPEPFVLNVTKRMNDLFPGDGTESVKFEGSDLFLIMDAIDNKPALPSGYHYNYQLQTIGFYNDYYNQDLNNQYTIDWYSNLIQGQLSINSVSIFIKSVDAAIINNGYYELYSAPNGNQIRYYRIAISGGGNPIVNYNVVGNNDPDPTDNYTYPYIDTDSHENALYYGYLQINPLPTYANTNSNNFVLHVLCIPTKDQ